MLTLFLSAPTNEADGTKYERILATQYHDPSSCYWNVHCD